MDTRELFRILVKEKGSDLLIKENSCPAMRIQGKIKFVSESRVPAAFARSLSEEVIPEPLKNDFQRHGEVDCSYTVPEVGRFRANVFRQQGRLCLIFRHVNDRMARASGWGIIGAGIGIAGQVAEEDWLKVLGVGVGVGGGVYQLSFSRGQELESDELGVRYMTRAGYNPYGQVQVMRILAEASGNPNASDFFSTHPNPGRRIRDLEAHIADRYPDHAVPGKYTFNPEAFKANVLDELAKLPPAPDTKKAGD